MSQHMTKPTKSHLRLAKTDIPGHPPSLIRVFAVHSVDSYGSKLSSCGKRKLSSGWADPNLILVFAGRICHFADFVKYFEHNDWQFFSSYIYIV